ncbi:MAG: DNA polymerase III subunit delta' [Proteobacteria bacterium]|nr:DNA polymerase III subunit delta' [Pseudomonadota bacterium]
MASLLDDDEADVIEAVEIEVDAEVTEVPAEVTPRRNPDFLGHDAIEKSLLRDYLAGRMPHALVLAGMPGIGKATLAFRLARFLLSQSDGGLFGAAAPPASLRVAPERPVFRRVASSGHVDLLTVEREFDEKKGRLKTEISVEAVRRIHPFLRMTAAENGWRVVIIDSAEYLNASSQNALLKILEEPPSKSILILTTSQPGSFLPTIRSRCQMVHMEPLAEEVIGTLLDKMAPGLGESEKISLSRLAQGSIGKALQFHQDGGIVLYRQLLEVVTTMPELNMVKVHELAEKLGKYGAEQDYSIATEIMIGWCEIQARAVVREKSSVDILPGDAAVFERIKNIYPPQHFLNAWEKISRLVQQTDIYNLDRRQTIIGAFLALQQPEYQGLNL